MPFQTINFHLQSNMASLFSQIIAIDKGERVKHQLFCSTSNPSAREPLLHTNLLTIMSKVVKSHASATDTLCTVTRIFHSHNIGKLMCSLALLFWMGILYIWKLSYHSVFSMNKKQDTKNCQPVEFQPPLIGL